jgi:hypothetical protein
MPRRGTAAGRKTEPTHEADAAAADEEEWPPRANRLQAIRWRADAHLERGEFIAAARTLTEAFELVGPPEDEVFRGLHHLAAAGYRHQTGDIQRAARQLARARRRLAPFPDCAEHVHAVEQLLTS